MILFNHNINKYNLFNHIDCYYNQMNPLHLIRTITYFDIYSIIQINLSCSLTHHAYSCPDGEMHQQIAGGGIVKIAIV